MIKLIITDYDNSIINYNINSVVACKLMMQGIDYTEEDGVTTFAVDFNEGWLFNIEGYLSRVLGL